jgi:N-acyl-L-homoserine lactone synthetase
MKGIVGLKFITCSTPEQIRAAQRLRYEVFCVEKGWIDAAKCPGHVESDELDEGAVHFLALEDGVPVGTIRLLLGKKCDLPAAAYLPVEELGVEPWQMVETSRLATRRKKRSQDLRVFLGLTTLMWEWAMEHDMKVWLVIADVPLHHMLTRLGMPEIARGDEIEYLGSKCVPAAFELVGTGFSLRRRATSVTTSR